MYCIDASLRIVTKALYRTAPPFSILNGWTPGDFLQRLETHLLYDLVELSLRLSNGVLLHLSVL